MRARPLALYLAVTGAVVAAIAVDTVYLGLGEALMAKQADGWRQRVARGEQLVAASRHEEAALSLEQLDEIFPARHVKHALDTEREKLLVCLGRAYQGLGRDKAARATLAKLVDFDPRNWHNHRHLAACLLEQGRTADAEAALRAALSIHPTDRDTTGMLIRLLAGEQRHADVVVAARAFVDAVAVCDVTVEHGDRRVVVPVLMDGLWHDSRVQLYAPPGSTDKVAVRSDGAPLELGTCRAEPPVRVGMPCGEPAVIPPERWQPRGDDAHLTAVPPGGLATLVLRVRVPVRIDALVAGEIEKAFEATGQRAELAALRGRMRLVAEESR